MKNIKRKFQKSNIKNKKAYPFNFHKSFLWLFVLLLSIVTITTQCNNNNNNSGSNVVDTTDIDRRWYS